MAIRLLMQNAFLSLFSPKKLCSFYTFLLQSHSDPTLRPSAFRPSALPQRSISVPIHLVLLAFQDTADASPDQLGALSGIDRGPNTGTLVVVNNGASLGVIGVQSLPEGTDVVVGTLDEGLAGDVVSHGLLRGVDCKK